MKDKQILRRTLKLMTWTSKIAKKLVKEQGAYSRTTKSSRKSPECVKNFLLVRIFSSVYACVLMPVGECGFLQVNKDAMLNVVSFHVYLSYTILVFTSFIYTGNNMITTRILTRFGRRGSRSSVYVEKGVLKNGIHFALAS